MNPYLNPNLSGQDVNDIPASRDIKSPENVVTDLFKSIEALDTAMQTDRPFINHVADALPILKSMVSNAEVLIRELGSEGIAALVVTLCEKRLRE